MSSFILRQTVRNVRSISSRTNAPAGLRAMGARGVFTPSEIAYTASAKATGAGRNGNVKVDNGFPPLDQSIPLQLPKEMGGSGKGLNPEQLFSAGYSGCFLGALQAMAKKAGKDASNATVNVRTGIGAAADKEAGGFALSVEIIVSGFNDKAVVDAAHAFCPYSRALNRGATTKVTIA